MRGTSTSTMLSKPDRVAGSSGTSPGASSRRRPRGSPGPSPGRRRPPRRPARRGHAAAPTPASRRRPGRSGGRCPWPLPTARKTWKPASLGVTWKTTRVTPCASVVRLGGDHGAVGVEAHGGRLGHRRAHLDGHLKLRSEARRRRHADPVDEDLVRGAEADGPRRDLDAARAGAGGFHLAGAGRVVAVRQEDDPLLGRVREEGARQAQRRPDVGGAPDRGRGDPVEVGESSGSRSTSASLPNATTPATSPSGRSSRASRTKARASARPPLPTESERSTTNTVASRSAGRTTATPARARASAETTRARASRASRARRSPRPCLASNLEADNQPDDEGDEQEQERRGRRDAHQPGLPGRGCGGDRAGAGTATRPGQAGAASQRRIRTSASRWKTKASSTRNARAIAASGIQRSSRAGGRSFPAPPPLPPAVADPRASRAAAEPGAMVDSSTSEQATGADQVRQPPVDHEQRQQHAHHGHRETNADVFARPDRHVCPLELPLELLAQVAGREPGERVLPTTSYLQRNGPRLDDGRAAHQPLEPPSRVRRLRHRVPAERIEQCDERRPDRKRCDKCQ